MRTRFQIIALSGALSLLSACHKSSQSDLPTGKLRISSSASAADSSSGSTEVCAQFSLQPYVPAADGTPTNAGSPIVFNSSAANANDASSFTDQIVGCIDGTNDTAGYNWGYIVTVTNFSECGTTPGTLGAALTDVSPSTTTIDVPVECAAGLDTAVPIHVSVAVSSAGAGGYVDISAGVNATDTQVGCKQADINFSTDQLLHFGESYVSTDGSVPTGLVAVDDNGAPTQFGGIVNPSGSTDTFYTGDIDPTTVNTIYQTFLNPCRGGSDEYADTSHAQCVSNDTGLPAGTAASLADAFVEMQGQGFAAASVVSGGLVIYSSMGADPITMNASSFVPGYNALTTTNIASTDPSINAVTVTGVYVNQEASMSFLIAASESDGTPLYATLTYVGGAWTVGSFYAVTGHAIDCNGLYAAPSGCFSPGTSTACTSASSERTGLPIVIHPINLGSYYLFVSSELAGGAASITVQTAGEPAMTLPGGGFSPFANKLGWGASYNVSVTAPAGMTCMTEYGSGTIFADTTVYVICAPTSWQEVAVGGYVVAGIASDGTLWTWGNNYYSALGQGAATPTDQAVPNQVGTDNHWKQVSLGLGMGEAVKTDGTLWAWGGNAANGLGDGTSNTASSPIQIGTATNWAQVSVQGNGTVVGIKSNGTVWVWGNASAATPTQLGTDTDWASANGGFSTTVLLKTGQTAWTWGGTGQPVQIGAGSSWTHAAAGTGDVFLIKSDGTLWGYGQNIYGELGNGTTGAQASLVQIGAPNTFAAVASGARNSGAVTTTGDLYVWGANSKGEIGNGTTTASLTPALVGHGYTAYATFDFYQVSFGLKTDNTLWSWGDGTERELGNFNTSGSTTPSLIP